MLTKNTIPGFDFDCGYDIDVLAWVVYYEYGMYRRLKVGGNRTHAVPLTRFHTLLRFYQ